MHNIILGLYIVICNVHTCMCTCMLQYWYVMLVHVYVHTLHGHAYYGTLYMHVFVCMDKLHACNSIARAAELILLLLHVNKNANVHGMQHFSNHAMNVGVMLQL